MWYPRYHDCGRSVLNHTRRAAHLHADHPTPVLLASADDSFFLSGALPVIEQKWNISHDDCTRGSLHAAAARQQLVAWHAAGKCTDLLALRPLASVAHLSDSGPAAYIRHDDRGACSYRARLRLNRSYLNSSQYCRGILPSAQCACEDGDETPDHLLRCPLYDDIRERHLEQPRPPIAFTTALLLGEVGSLARPLRLVALRRGAAFLCAVAALRDGGL